MVHVDSKPLALSISSLVVGTAQGDVDHMAGPLANTWTIATATCGNAQVRIAARRPLPQSSAAPQTVAPTTTCGYRRSNSAIAST